MRRLVVTADDFGAAREINEAVEAAHRRGILTAASLMVSGPAAADAIARARRMPSLRVGLHVVLVEGRPVLPASTPVKRPVCALNVWVVTTPLPAVASVRCSSVSRALAVQ